MWKIVNNKEQRFLFGGSSYGAEQFRESFGSFQFFQSTKHTDSLFLQGQEVFTVRSLQGFEIQGAFSG